MKKLLLTLLVCSSLLIKAQMGTSLKTEGPTVETADDLKIAYIQKNSGSNGSEAVLWSQDFANGIPANWENFCKTSGGILLPNGSWEYRGTTTLPDNTTGSRGGSAGAGTPLQSITASNGYVIFDGDYLDDGGISANAGMGIAPAPHVGILITDTIDLTGHPFVEIKFNASVRRLDSDFLLAVSTDGGVTYKDTINLYPNLSANTTIPRNAELSVNLSQSIGNEALVRIAFIYDGNNRGSYYWMMDDIEIRDLPKNELRFTSSGSAPVHDMIFDPGGAPHPKQGHISLNQVVPVNFDSNILNHGSQTQTNVTLKVEIYDSTNTLVNTLISSPPVASMANADTVDFSSFFTPNWTPTVANAYTIVYTLQSDSITTTAPRDSFNFFVTAEPSKGYAAGESNSHDYSVFSNSFGTNALGSDGGGMAVQLNLSNPNSANGKVGITGFELRYSTLTVDGGDIQFEVYDTAGFVFTTGFGAPALVSQQFTVAPGSSGNLIRYDLTNGTGNPILLDADQYFFAVYMFSNNNANEIRLANDASFSSPLGSHAAMYNVGDSRWFSGFSNSTTFNAPWIRVITKATTIGLDENPFQQLTLFPNPAKEQVNYELSEGGKYTLELTDVTGKTIMSKSFVSNGNQKHSLDLTGLSKGLYTIKVYNANTVFSNKLVVE